MVSAASARWYAWRFRRAAEAAPNPAHLALASWEGLFPSLLVVTQNVDRLHQRAGSRRVVELHGALADVACLRCGRIEARADLQARLLDANPGWLESAIDIQPDGDAELEADRVREFTVVACRLCGGELKPDVVFFGGSVSERTLAAAWELFAEAEALLVVGSSLAVYSGFRFVRCAQDQGVPVAIVNVGPTRADEIAAVKVSAPVGTILPRLAETLGVRS